MALKFYMSIIAVKRYCRPLGRMTHSLSSYNDRYNFIIINNNGTTQTQVTLTIATLEGTTSLVAKARPETDDKQ